MTQSRELLMMLKEHHKESYFHSVRVGADTVEFAISLGLANSEKKIEQYYLAGLLHDVGKIIIPTEILSKPGKLTEEEFEVMKTHTTASKFFLSGYSKMVQDAALHHHQGSDGKGYPDKNVELSDVAKIVHICDVYDALTHKRDYKEALSKEEALEIMHKTESSFDSLYFKKFEEEFLVEKERKSKSV